MNIFPPFKKTKLKLVNPERFKDYVREITEDKYGNSNHRAKMKGTISESGFLLEKKTYYSNTFKPKIKGKYIKKNDNLVELELSIESNNFPILLITPILIFCIYGAMTNSIKYAILIFMICLPIIYLMSWIFYQIEYKKTKTELNNLIDKANA